MIRHLGGEPLQFDHAFSLEIPDGIIEGLVLRLQRGPCHENVLEHPQHKAGLGVKGRRGEGDKQLEDTFTDNGILQTRQLL